MQRSINSPERSTMKRMEETSEKLGKSPTISILQEPPRSFTVMDPTTLSKAFEVPSSSNAMISCAPAANAISIFPQTNIVDLNIPLPLAEVEKSLSPSSNGYLASVRVPTGTRRHIPTLDQALEKELMKDGSTAAAADPRKLRRTISNRLSAQRSRLKKAQHVIDLEKKIKELQETIAILSPQIENYKNKERALLIQKATLEQQLHNCMIRSNLCSIEIEENKREVQRLKELQKMQREEMLFASNFGMQQRQYINMNMHGSHHPQLQPSSGFRHYHEESNYTTNADPTPVVDQYINFDALN